MSHVPNCLSKSLIHVIRTMFFLSSHRPSTQVDYSIVMLVESRTMATLTIVELATSMSTPHVQPSHLLSLINLIITSSTLHLLFLILTEAFLVIFVITLVPTNGSTDAMFVNLMLIWIAQPRSQNQLQLNKFNCTTIKQHQAQLFLSIRLLELQW